MNFYTSVNIRGNSILYRGYKNGKRETRRESFAPSFYIPEPNGHYKSLVGQALKQISFDDIRDARSFLDEYRGTENFKIFGNSDYVQQYIYDSFPEAIEYDFKQLKILTIDIETECEHGFPNIKRANEKLLIITIRMNGETHMFTMRPCTIPDVFVHHADTEEELITNFYTMLKKLDPDIITGWNIKYFDLPYIVNRAEVLMSEDIAAKISPWGYIKKREKNVNGRDYYWVEIAGYMVLDYYELYKKFSGKTQESYSLNHISEVELGEKKLDYSSYGTLREFYAKNYQMFAEYNVQDVILVEKIDKKLKLIELAASISYEAKINFDTVFFSTKIWESICYDYLKDFKIVPGLKESYSKDDQFVGAYVKEVNPGLYKNIISFDATSLYPSIIMQFNISPDTIETKGSGWVADSFLIENNSSLDEYIKSATANGRCMSATGSSFRMDKKGFIPILIERTFNQRQEAKKEMISLEKSKELNGDPDGSLTARIISLKIKESVKKILANSFYGCLGNPGFVYSSPELATAVTMTGQLVIKTAEKSIQAYFKKVTGIESDVVIASDTDSLYIDMSTIVNKVGVSQVELIDFLDSAAKKAIQPVLDKSMEELGRRLNCTDNRLKFKREVIASSGIFVAKKRYALCVYDKEGVRYTKPWIKIMGMETARSSTPQLVRDKLKRAIEIILMENEQSLIYFVSNFRKMFFEQPIEKVAFPRGISGLEVYDDPDTIYKKSTPIATKAALLHNHQIKKLNLQEAYPLLKEGDKIKFIHIKVPNPYGKHGRDKVMAFMGSTPKEFNLENYVDYEMQFEKTFLEPLKNVTNIIGWNVEVKVTLESFFG